MSPGLQSPDLFERREIGFFLLLIIFAILMFKLKLFPWLPTEPLSMSYMAPHPPTSPIEY